ncbi:hypothetical protein [Neorhizobium tomejilense]|uniref:hypothetical protein n=1 Tax=Neorhizobium tomejilense TaxID=2093828 RepID=UPI003ECE6032
MTNRVSMALKAAARGMEDAFGWLVLWWPLAPVCIFVGATGVAVLSQGADPFGIKFAAGVVTMTFYVVAIFREPSERHLLCGRDVESLAKSGPVTTAETTL